MLRTARCAAGAGTCWCGARPARYGTMITIIIIAIIITIIIIVMISSCLCTCTTNTTNTTDRDPQANKQTKLAKKSRGRRGAEVAHGLRQSGMSRIRLLLLLSLPMASPLSKVACEPWAWSSQGPPAEKQRGYGCFCGWRRALLLEPSGCFWIWWSSRSGTSRIRLIHYSNRIPCSPNVVCVVVSCLAIL